MPASAVLQRLHDEVPTDRFTLGWLMHRLDKHSFGIIMLLLSLVAVTPGLSIAAGLILMIPAFQMMAGKPAPVFPHRIAALSLPTKHLAALVQRFVPMLRHLEKMVHPRWRTPVDLTKRLVGAVVLILSATLVFVPIPLSNVVPASVIAVISLAYLEDDGALLAIGLLAAAIVLAIGAEVVRDMLLGTKWIIDLRH
ncbi:exopolysaccharide biosynthesis protein [Bradyrhizobium sp.]|uniref:exopolysaccharide biosynthesis protein n=1 Tax=Bradyrhizobium sp. TaxID=376 RepID=UPI003C4A6FAE